jgi:hypothetical protein
MPEQNPTPPKAIQKKALVDRWFKGKRRLFFLVTTAISKLTFNERLVLSFLVSQARFGQAPTLSEIARSLGLDRG